MHGSHLHVFASPFYKATSYQQYQCCKDDFSLTGHLNQSSWTSSHIAMPTSCAGMVLLEVSVVVFLLQGYVTSAREVSCILTFSCRVGLAGLGMVSNMFKASLQ